MTRINVYSRLTDENPDTEPCFLGWFNRDKVTEEIREGTRWDGNNHRGIMSGLQCGHEELLRTAKGQWVRYYDARNEFNGPEFYEYITDGQARDWLLRNGNDETAQKWFGMTEQEKSPAAGKLGGAALIRFGTDLLAQLDELADSAGISRSELVRRFAAEGVQTSSIALAAAS